MPKDSIVFLDEGVQAIIPKALYQAIVKVQAAGNLEWGEACVRTAELSNHGSVKFAKAVKDAAMGLYRSRHFSEMNKALDTRHQSGVEEGKAYAKIRYPCSVCGKDMVWNLTGSEDRENILGMLKKGGIGDWTHVTCKTPTS